MDQSSKKVRVFCTCGQAWKRNTWKQQENVEEEKERHLFQK